LRAFNSSRVHLLSPEELSVFRQLDPAKIPQHVAIIMDGNGRWAGKRTLKRFLGHQRGAESVQFVVETASRIDLPWLTLYAFSLENNLRRPRSEVNFLMKLLKSFLAGNVKRMDESNVRVTYIGRTEELPSEVRETMQWASEATAKNTGTTLTLALNYGARSEIVDALRQAVRDAIASSNGDMNRLWENIRGLEEQDVSARLYTAGMPDPDLVIRTSGEQRISNFLLWQIAYAEIYVTDRLWPDFRGVHLLEALADFQRRERRYGGLGDSFTDEDIEGHRNEAELARS
jgi:undecaprenyl diphosphate synthase